MHQTIASRVNRADILVPHLLREIQNLGCVRVIQQLADTLAGIIRLIVALSPYILDDQAYIILPPKSLDVGVKQHVNPFAPYGATNKEKLKSLVGGQGAGGYAGIKYLPIDTVW